MARHTYWPCPGRAPGSLVGFSLHSSHVKLPSSNATPGKCTPTPTIAAPDMAQPWLYSHSRHWSIQSLQTSDSLSWVCRGRHGWRTCHTSGVHHLRAPATAPCIFPSAQRCALSSAEAALLFKKTIVVEHRTTLTLQILSGLIHTCSS